MPVCPCVSVRLWVSECVIIVTISEGWENFSGKFCIDLASSLKNKKIFLYAHVCLSVSYNNIIMHSSCMQVRCITPCLEVSILMKISDFHQLKLLCTALYSQKAALAVWVLRVHTS